MNRKVLVDASAFLAVILNEQEKERIVEATKGCQALSPGCLKWEVGNAFSAMEKRRRLSAEQVQAGIQVFEKIPYEEVQVDLSEGPRIASKHGIYAYDAYYLAAASGKGVELLSLDKAMKDIAEKEGIKLRNIS